MSFIKPCLSKLSSSPTKVGEYLAAGLPVISTAGIGDVDDLLTGRNNGGRGPVGVWLGVTGRTWPGHQSLVVEGEPAAAGEVPRYEVEAALGACWQGRP